MKEYLSQKGIAFTERDVGDPQVRDELTKMNEAFIPVTIIDGKIVRGFNRRAIDAALAG